MRDAKSIGFTINEISQLMDAWYNNKITNDEKLGVLDEKLLLIEEKIIQLQEMKQRIIQFKIIVETESCH